MRILKLVLGGILAVLALLVGLLVSLVLVGVGVVSALTRRQPLPKTPTPPSPRRPAARVRPAPLHTADTIDVVATEVDSR